MARRKRDQDGTDELWHKLIDLYRGKHFQTQLLANSEDRIAVNICFATINVVEPSVAVNYPKILVWARKPEDEVKGQILETVLNYWWRHFKVQHEMRLSVKDFLVLGHGWLKVGWRYVEEQAQVDEQALAEASNAADSSNQVKVPADPTEPTANDPESAETSGSPQYEVAEDRPFVERVSPFDIYIDPEAKTVASAKWIAQRIVKPLEEVRQDKRYRLKGRAALRPDSQSNPDWLLEGTADPEDDIRRVTLYEFWDLDMGTMCVFSHSGEEMLLDPIPQPYAFGHPFVMLRNYEVPDEFYPMGDIEALEPLQMELDKTRSQMMNHRKRFNRKWLYDPNAFDQTGISALNKDVDNTLVPVIETNRPLNEVLVPIPQVPVEPQLYQYANDTLAVMDRVSGASEYERGATPEIRRTATEASMIQDAANARASDKLARVELVIADVATRVVALAQQYLTQDQVARVVGKNGFPIWVPYGRDDIQGEYDFEVEAGSTQPKNDAFRRNQALQLLQALTPWAQAGLVNAQTLLHYALQYGFQVKNPDEFLALAAPPQQQQKSPRQSLIETMNYKDAPPDVQRQIEAAAGFQPSQVGGSSPAEGALAKIVPQVTGQQQQGQAANAQVAAQIMNLVHQAQQSQLDRQHEAVLANAAQGHDMRSKLADAAVAADQQQAAHRQQLAQAVQEAQLEALLQAQAEGDRYAYQSRNYAQKLGITE